MPHRDKRLGPKRNIKSERSLDEILESMHQLQERAAEVVQQMEELKEEIRVHTGGTGGSGAARGKGKR